LYAPYKKELITRRNNQGCFGGRNVVLLNIGQPHWKSISTVGRPWVGHIERDFFPDHIGIPCFYDDLLMVINVPQAALNNYCNISSNWITEIVWKLQSICTGRTKCKYRSDSQCKSIFLHTTLLFSNFQNWKLEKYIDFLYKVNIIIIIYFIY